MRCDGGGVGEREGSTRFAVQRVVVVVVSDSRMCKLKKIANTKIVGLAHHIRHTRPTPTTHKQNSVEHRTRYSSSWKEDHGQGQERRRRRGRRGGGEGGGRETW